MVQEVRDNLSKIIEACKQMHVKSLFLVGSGARVNDFTATSDLDFLYTLKKDRDSSTQHGFNFFDFVFKLEEITGRKIDLIAEDRIRNKYMRQSLLEDRIKIYEA